MSGAVIATQPKQSTLPVLKGSEWIAYSLAIEVAWVAVDIAFCMRDIINWEEWSVLESVSGEREEEFDSVVATAEQTSEGGRAELTTHNRSDPATLMKRVKDGSTTGAKREIEIAKRINCQGYLPLKSRWKPFSRNQEFRLKTVDNMSNSNAYRDEFCKCVWPVYNQ